MKTIYTRFPDAMAAEVEKLAAAEKRKTASMVEVLVAEALEARQSKGVKA